jgi:hypothetical protein
MLQHAAAGCKLMGQILAGAGIRKCTFGKSSKSGFSHARQIAFLELFPKVSFYLFWVQ